MNKKWIILIILIVSLVYFANTYFYYPFYSDDSFISLRYVDRFLDGKGLTWNDEGPHVEGYSNFLWMMLIAAFGYFGINLVLISRILGILFLYLPILILIYYFAIRSGYSRRLDIIFAALLFYVATGTTGVWAIAGLEQPLVGFLYVLVIIFGYEYLIKRDIRNLIILSFVLGLLSITRADGPIFSIAVAFGFALAEIVERRRIPVKAILILAIFPILFYGGQIIFRISYYGDYIPNTALVKVSPSLNHAYDGFIYIMKGLGSMVPFSLIGLVAIFFMINTKKYRKRGLYLFSALFIYLAYMVFIGGDIFPAYRHLLPVVIIFAFAIIDGGSLLLEKIRLESRAIVIALAIIFTFLMLSLQYYHYQYENARTEDWEWYNKKLGIKLKNMSDDKDVSLAITAAGALPYYYEKPCIDMLGLNDYYLPRNPPEDFHEAWIGHGLGNGGYILDCNPDMMVFGGGGPPIFRSAEEMDTMPEFHRKYIYSYLDIEGEKRHARVYFNKYKSALGIEVQNNVVTIPIYLMQNNDSTVVYTKNNGDLYAIAKPNEEYHIEFACDYIQCCDRNCMIDIFEIGFANDSLLKSTISNKNDTIDIKLKNISDKSLEFGDIILRYRKTQTKRCSALSYFSG
ncbi:MAG: hypothetical protein ACLFSQ_06925 [Candidatus Zixiibacteriota bacterium]